MVRVPPSKSATNRALLLAALTEVPVEIVRPLESDDTAALRALPRGDGRVDRRDGGRACASADRCGDRGTARSSSTPPIRGRPRGFWRPPPPRRPGASCSAVRRGSASGRWASSSRRCARPVRASRIGRGRAVSRSRSRAARSRRRRWWWTPRVRASFSPLCFWPGSPWTAASACAPPEGSRRGLTSRRRSRSSATSAHFVEAGAGFVVRRGAAPAGRYETPGDYSSAVPLAAAVGIAGGAVTLTGLRWPSSDADAGALPVLEQMGVRLVHGPDGLAASAERGASRRRRGRGRRLSRRGSGARGARGPVDGRDVFSGVGHLRLKESDRLAALAELVVAVGAKAAIGDDSLAVIGAARGNPRRGDADRDLPRSPHRHGGRSARAASAGAAHRESRLRREVVPGLLSGPRGPRAPLTVFTSRQYRDRDPEDPSIRPAPRVCPSASRLPPAAHAGSSSWSSSTRRSLPCATSGATEASCSSGGRRSGAGASATAACRGRSRCRSSCRRPRRRRSLPPRGFLLAAGDLGDARWELCLGHGAALACPDARGGRRTGGSRQPRRGAGCAAPRTLRARGARHGARRPRAPRPTPCPRCPRAARGALGGERLPGVPRARPAGGIGRAAALSRALGPGGAHGPRAGTVREGPGAAFGRRAARLRGRGFARRARLGPGPASRSTRGRRGEPASARGSGADGARPSSGLDRRCPGTVGFALAPRFRRGPPEPGRPGGGRSRFRGSCPQPEGPDGWRGALWVPCGTLAASVRFCEWFAGAVAGDPRGALGRAREVLGSPGFAPFVADATGEAPLPARTREAWGATRATVHAEAAAAGDGADDPGGRIEALLAAGRRDAALEEARRWVASAPDARPEAWFSISAHLAAETGESLAPWLAALEAEREIAGGRPVEARARLERIVRGEGVGHGDAAPRPAAPGRGHGAARRRRARFAPRRRVADGASAGARRGDDPGAASRGDRPGAGRRARRRPRAAGRSGSRRHGIGARRAGRDGARARAGPCSGRQVRRGRRASTPRSGRPSSEAATTGSRRAFSPRRRAGCSTAASTRRALVRLEEAIGAAADEPAERAALAIDLAATFYHSGRADRSEAALGRGHRGRGRRRARRSRADLAEQPGRALARPVRVRGRGARDRSARTERAAGKGTGRDCSSRCTSARASALRRGDLSAAARDNAEARGIAEAIGDRLEIGELWLEEGDRCAYEGDRDGARRAWELAAQDPPDRCESDRVARERLAELDWTARATARGSPAEAEALFAGDAFRAAETVVRWCGLRGRARVARPLRDRAAAVLREAGRRGAGRARRRRLGREGRGGRSARAARRRGRPDRRAPRSMPRRALRALGLSRLAVRDDAGRELARLGDAAATASSRGARSRPAPRASRSRSRRARRPRCPRRSRCCSRRCCTARRRMPRRSRLSEGWRALGIVTADAAMEEPYRRLSLFAPQPVTVLVLGESGSGKEAVARAVHRLSPRASGPFVPVNMPAIPAALLESELFGHARGRVHRRRARAPRTARGGRAGERSSSTRSATWPRRSSPSSCARCRSGRSGGSARTAPRPIDVRVVSATSRDLARDVEAGRFREDLFYRLHVARRRGCPPLRERGRDALLLARHFLDALRARVRPRTAAAHARGGGGARGPRVARQRARAPERDGAGRRALRRGRPRRARRCCRSRCGASAGRTSARGRLPRARRRAPPGPDRRRARSARAAIAAGRRGTSASRVRRCST